MLKKQLRALLKKTHPGFTTKKTVMRFDTKKKKNSALYYKTNNLAHCKKKITLCALLKETTTSFTKTIALGYAKKIASGFAKKISFAL